MTSATSTNMETSRPAPARVSSAPIHTPPPAHPAATSSAMQPRNGIVGTFSLGPATKTTVVTTTTTTTTSFPPLIMKGPRSLRDRDPDEYPLAASPTPRAIKRLKFDVGGRSACFEEAENATQKLQEFARQQDSLIANHGSIVSLETRDQSHSRLPPTTRASHRSLNSPSNNGSRPSLAISKADAVEMDSFIARNRPLVRQQPVRRRRVISETNSNDEIPTSPLENDDIDISFAVRTPTEEPAIAGEQLSRTTTTVSSLDDSESFSSFSRPLPPNNQRVASTSASLPSPSLSPITAAASLNRAPSKHRTSRTGLPDSDSKTQPVQCTSPAEEYGLRNDDPGVGQIPELLDAFDDMPNKMKTYVMYQLLRRCPKSTLQFVAEAVDPAMRCDFLSRLPLELSLNVLQHLDATSMCRAAQVSRKWRQVTDTDEKSWKALIEAEDFNVTLPELRQAVSEGWGWQITGSATELEEISKNIPNEPRALVPVEHASHAKSVPETVRSLKRKKGSKSLAGGSEKRRKRKAAPDSFTEGLDALEKKQGPNAFAIAAVAAVPRGIGVQSLQQVHFFKSLYQRHKNLRRAWIDPESTPKHYAFKAHDRRVVTCLQFDEHKIITGSDDCNIDIFETKSGRVMNRLRGHEGGVWALEYHGDMLVSGSTDRTVRIWDLRKGRMLHVFQGHTSTVRCLQILQPTKIGETADGKAIMMPRKPLIITGSRDSFCRVWELPQLGDAPQIDDPANADANAYFRRTLRGHSNSVRAIAAHGDTLVSGSYDYQVRVWKISNGECVHQLRGHSSKVYSVVLDHGRNRCISGSMDYMVKVWSLETGTCLFNLSGHTSLVGLLDLSSDILVSAAADATLRVWDPATGLCRHELTGHTGAITCFLHDKRKIISGSEKTLKLWDIETGECVRDLLTDLGSVWQIKFDERRCVAAVQRQDYTYIEVIDFDQYHQGGKRGLLHDGKRTVVDSRGRIVPEDPYQSLDERVEDGGNEPGDIIAIDPLP